jgi:hypothetical protein
MDENDQEHEVNTPEGGQLIIFNEEGLVCHLPDDSSLYQYELDNDSLHPCPFAAHIVNIEECEHPFIPGIDDYLVAHVGGAILNPVSCEYAYHTVETANVAPVVQAVNWKSTFTLPPTSKHSASGKPQSM